MVELEPKVPRDQLLHLLSHSRPSGSSEHLDLLRSPVKVVGHDRSDTRGAKRCAGTAPGRAGASGSRWTALTDTPPGW